MAKNKPEEVYGIDLGTTNSCIALVGDDGLPHVINNADDKYTTPSVVYYDTDQGVVVVGEEAKLQMQGDPERSVAFIKRELGNPNYSRSIDGEEITPLKISAMILKKVVADANAARAEQGKDPITKAVITVPAYFGNTEKELTRRAGELAGLEVLRLIPEPTAAAISYGTTGPDGKIFMVYDLGGGTFDISIMRVKGNDFEELSNDGDHHLGGVDWDIMLLNYALRQHDLGIEYEDIQDSRDVGRMLINAERAKVNLSNNTSVNLNLIYKRKTYITPISRDDFEDLTYDRVDSTIILMKRAIKHSRVPITADDISEIILVGGSSSMPMIRKAVEKAFPKAQIRLDRVKSNKAVAEGAAIYAHRLGVTPPPPPLPSRSYGISCFVDDKEVVSNVLTRKDPIGTESFRMYETLKEGQTSATLAIYENISFDEHTPLLRSTLLASNELTWGVPVPKGTDLKVIMKLSPDGTLRVSGECNGHQATYNVTVTGASENELNEARRDIENKTIL